MREGNYRKELKIRALEGLMRAWVINGKACEKNVQNVARKKIKKKTIKKTRKSGGSE